MTACNTRRKYLNLSQYTVEPCDDSSYEELRYAEEMKFPYLKSILAKRISEIKQKLFTAQACQDSGDRSSTSFQEIHYEDQNEPFRVSEFEIVRTIKQRKLHRLMKAEQKQLLRPQAPIILSSPSKNLQLEIERKSSESLHPKESNDDKTNGFSEQSTQIPLCTAHSENMINSKNHTISKTTTNGIYWMSIIDGLKEQKIENQKYSRFLQAQQIYYGKIVNTKSRKTSPNQSPSISKNREESKQRRNKIDIKGFAQNNTLLNNSNIIQEFKFKQADAQNEQNNQDQAVIDSCSNKGSGLKENSINLQSSKDAQVRIRMILRSKINKQIRHPQQPWAQNCQTPNNGEHIRCPSKLRNFQIEIVDSRQQDISMVPYLCQHNQSVSNQNSVEKSKEREELRKLSQSQPKRRSVMMNYTNSQLANIESLNTSSHQVSCDNTSPRIEAHRNNKAKWFINSQTKKILSGFSQSQNSSPVNSRSIVQQRHKTGTINNKDSYKASSSFGIKSTLPSSSIATRLSILSPSSIRRPPQILAISTSTAANQSDYDCFQTPKLRSSSRMKQLSGYTASILKDHSYSSALRDMQASRLASKRGSMKEIDSHQPYLPNRQEQQSPYHSVQKRQTNSISKGQFVQNFDISVINCFFLNNGQQQ